MAVTNDKLAGKIAVITGGTTGIGRAAAQCFRDAGATVIVTGTSPANLDKVRAELGVEAVRSDVSNLADIQALMAGLRERHGRIDVLFANAGIPGSPAPIEQIDAAAFDRVFAVNVRGLFFTLQQALPLMSTGGSIVLTSSVGAHIGMAGVIAYAASKAAVRSIGRSLAAELIPRGIRVNTLTPGLIRTEIFSKLGVPAEEIIGMLEKQVPLQRAGDPLEAAAAALFLACSDSSFMTGAELRVAGGQSDL